MRDKKIMLVYLDKYINGLWYLILEMSPWLLLGLVFAGLLKVYFPNKHIEKYLGNSNFRSAVNASLLGVPMPLCSCGVIPAGISFYRNGASKGATNSFLISTPQTGVDSILATYSMLGWPFALLRPVVAFVTGVVGGVFTNGLVKDKKQNQYIFDKIDIQNEKNKNNNFFEGKNKKPSLIRAADYAFIELLQDISKWLIIGFLVAALLSVALPDNFFTRFKGYGLLEMIIVLAASVPLYMCATGSIPVAAVLILKGVSPGAALVFLMAGPATNIATMTVLGKVMGRKSLLVYLFTIIGGALFFGGLINYIIPVEWIVERIPPMHAATHNHQIIPEWVQLTSAIFLITAIPVGYFYSIIQKRRKMKKYQGITIKVLGMSCSHCEVNIKQTLQKLRGITNVEADNRLQLVKISGTSIDLSLVQRAIEDIGYEYIGIV